MFRASSAHLQEGTFVYMQHMVLSLSMRVPGGLSVHSFNCSVWWTTSTVCTDLSHTVRVCLHEVRMFNTQQTSQSTCQPTNACNKIQFVKSIKLLHLLALGCHSLGTF